MRSILYFLLPVVFVSLLSQQCAVSTYSSDSKPISHALWDSLVKKHVTDKGWVDYQGLQQDSQRFNRYLELLGTHHPNKEHWSDNERKAYWINAYNAYTVDLILKHYPVESIKDIKSGIPFVNTVWDIKFINIEERTYDLNNLEHGILRKRWDDPRIHFAVNCASYSCPRLRDEAYVAEKLDQQLDDAGRKFLNDPRRNKVSKNDLQLSKIFNWYGSDFPNGTKFIRFLNQYTDIEINEDASISYLDYDWALNDSRKLGGE